MFYFLTRGVGGIYEVNTNCVGAIICIGCNWIHVTWGQMDPMVDLMLALNNEAFV